MAAAGEHCLSTAFCMWCQDALGWYIFASGNDGLKANARTTRRHCRRARWHRAVQSDEDLFRYRGHPPQGPAHQWRLCGAAGCCRSCPILATTTISAQCSRSRTSRGTTSWRSCRATAEGVALAANTTFVALDGTRTFSVQMRDVVIADTLVLADPSDDFIKRIRAGFLLLQAGMGIRADPLRNLGYDSGQRTARPRQPVPRSGSRSSSPTNLRGSKPPYLGSPPRRSTPTRPIGEP